MLRSALFLIGGLAAGWLVAMSWLAPAEPDAPSSADVGPRPRGGEPLEPLEPRVAALEAALASERAARRSLAAALESLETSLARVEASVPAAPAALRGRAAPDRGAERAAEQEPTERPFAERLRARRDASSQERRVARLVDAGFSPDRADWITRRESELRMSALEAQYEARRTGEPQDFAAADPDATLRAELGDADYERWLEATGRSTSVGVRDVLAGSPAEQAGLEPGDRLVTYGGQRVYDVGDLNRLTLEGTPGEPVTVNVERDGQALQLVIPRGPLGITGGGRFGRRAP